MTKEATKTDITALLSTEEGAVVQREAMLLQVRECHTVEYNVKKGKRRGSAVYDRHTNPTNDLSDAQIFALALNDAQ